MNCLFNSFGSIECLGALQQYLLNYVAINIVLWVILADVVLLIFVLHSMGETKSCCS
jgi:hypothetical protein